MIELLHLCAMAPVSVGILLAVQRTGVCVDIAGRGVMLTSMLDLTIGPRGVPAVAWSVALISCAIVAAVADRFGRQAPRGSCADPIDHGVFVRTEWVLMAAFALQMAVHGDLPTTDHAHQTAGEFVVTLTASGVAYSAACLTFAWVALRRPQAGAHLVIELVGMAMTMGLMCTALVLAA